MSVDELVDIVDENENVLKVVSKIDAHQEGLLHKCVIAQLIDSKNRWFLTRPSKKRQDEGQYVSPVGGHVSSGENDIDALKREVFEELGLKDFKYEYVGKGIFNREVIGRKENHFFKYYRIFTDAKPTLSHEAESGTSFTLDELKKELEKNPKDFGEAFHFIIKKFLPYLL